MSSKASYLKITNTTNQEFTISISEVDSFDWDGSSRPDNNFQGVTVKAGETNKQREELNGNARGAWFRMTMAFAGGQTVTFRNDQRDAINGISENPRNYALDGANADLFGLQQHVSSDGPTNEFTIRYADYKKTLSNWMKSVDGGRRISGFSLPGSRESAAYTSAAGPYKSQNLNIIQQLQSGIRYFDLNATIRNGKLYVCYGDVVDDGDRFLEIFKDFTDFLTENPTETVVVSCHDVKKAGEAFSNMVVDFLKGMGDRVYAGDVIPTLDEVRGKIVVVRRFAYQEKYGLNLTDRWPDDGLAITKYAGTDGTPQVIHVQDRNLAPTLTQKYQDISYLLDLADDYEGPLFINYCNVRPPLADMDLEAYAGKMNPKLKSYYSAASAQSNFGTVLMDFVTQDVVEAFLKTAPADQ